MSTSIGIVGLGLLGSAIAERLADRGYSLCGYDIRPCPVSGVTLCEQAKDVFESSSTVILSLPSTEIVCEVMEACATSMKAGQIVIDTTTGDPESTLPLAESLAAHGVVYLEANVAGSSELLRKGEAVLFIGGDPEHANRMIPLFVDLAPGVHYLGPVGSASRFKLVHNMILGLNRAVLAEGLRFAQSLGVNTREALQVLQQTAASSRVMEGKGLRMIESKYDPPQSRLSQHLKDVELMLKEAQRAGANVPMTTLHQQLILQAIAMGFGEMDSSAIIEAFSQNPNH